MQREKGIRHPRVLHLCLVGVMMLIPGGLVDAEDVVWHQVAKLVASDGADDDLFGYSLDAEGDAIVVGAQWDDDDGTKSGSAYVFVRNGTTWTQQTKLTASDARGGACFGGSVAISGSTIVVGAWAHPEYDPYPYLRARGAAYVFVRSGTTWTQEAKLVASDITSDDNFGMSVDISGDTIVVGMPNGDNTSAQSGSAYVFVRSGTTWTQQAKLKASDEAYLDHFGASVALSGSTALVGSPYDDDNGADSGSAYAFVRSGNTWTQQAKLKAASGYNLSYDLFGCAVSVSGDTALIGARDSGVNSSAYAGSAYVFVRSGTTWSQQAHLTASDAGNGDYLGATVTIAGDIAVAGAARDDRNGTYDLGAAYVFERSGSAWTQQAKLTASDGAAYDRFGISPAVMGDWIIVGAWGTGDGSSSSPGYAYAFRQRELVPPVADAGADQSIHAGDDVALDGGVYRPFCK